MVEMNANMKAYVESPINRTFNLSNKTIAQKVKNYGRFKAWLNSDVNKIIALLNVVEKNGVSPVFFAVYECSEGYNSKWGWLNHTYRKSNATSDAISVCEFIKTQSKNMNGVPAWIDYANYHDFVPSDVKEYGNNHYKNTLKSGTIGRILIAATAAATWETYYPLGLKQSYNKVQTYSAPITAQYKMILNWNGDLNSDDKDSDESSVHDDDVKKEEENAEKDLFDFSSLNSTMKNFTDNLVKKIEQMLIVNIFDYGDSKIKGNDFLKITETYKKVLKIKPTLNFNKIVDDLKNTIEDLVGDTIDGIVKSDKSDNDESEANPEEEDNPPTPTNGKMFFPLKNLSGVNFFKRSNHASGTVQKEMTYGKRVSGEFHSGYDIGTGGNSDYGAYAIRDCEVVKVGYDGSGGFSMQFKNTTDKYYILFFHLKPNSNLFKVGDTVKAGSKVATVGSSGGNYAIHLHVEVSPNRKFYASGDTINPENYLKVSADGKSDLQYPN